MIPAAEADVAVAQATLKQTQETLAQTELRAPLAGSLPRSFPPGALMAAVVIITVPVLIIGLWRSAA